MHSSMRSGRYCAPCFCYLPAMPTAPVIGTRIMESKAQLAYSLSIPVMLQVLWLPTCQLPAHASASQIMPEDSAVCSSEASNLQQLQDDWKILTDGVQPAR